MTILFMQGTSQHMAHTVDSLPLGGTLVGMMANRGLLNTNNLAKSAPAADTKYALSSICSETKKMHMKRITACVVKTFFKSS